MAHLRVRPSSLQGILTIPSSKSHTLRAILFAAMAHGHSEIRHYLPSPDAQAMIDAMRAFGATIDVFPEHLSLRGLGGKLKSPDDVIHAGNSGIVLRFVGALAGLCPTYTIITGDHSIRHNRPVKPLLEALSQLRAHAVSSRLDGNAPIIIQGPMKPGTARFCGKDSQPVSGMLIATSFLPGQTTLEIQDPGEKPWVDLTLHWLRKLGIAVTHRDHTHYTVSGGAHIEGFSETIPGDFSSAAFPIAAALITNSELTLNNVDMEDSQGDKALIEVLQKMGARIDIDANQKTLTVRKNSRLQGITLDVNALIDATPILAVIGCFAEGTTTITNAAIARAKESDRLQAITTELKKMGAQIEETADGLTVSRSPLLGAQVDSWSDHRIAMSLAVAALAAQGETRIEHVSCIAKTYPSFSRDFTTLGAQMESTP